MRPSKYEKYAIVLQFSVNPLHVPLCSKNVSCSHRKSRKKPKTLAGEITGRYYRINDKLGGANLRSFWSNFGLADTRHNRNFLISKIIA
jgi:hypothetical protein